MFWRTRKILNMFKKVPEKRKSSKAIWVVLAHLKLKIIFSVSQPWWPTFFLRPCPLPSPPNYFSAATALTRCNMLLTIISKIDAKLCEEFSHTKDLEFIHICGICLAKTNISYENTGKWLLPNSYLSLRTREFFREIFNSHCHLLVHKKH